MNRIGSGLKVLFILLPEVLLTNYLNIKSKLVPLLGKVYKAAQVLLIAVDIWILYKSFSKTANGGLHFSKLLEQHLRTEI